MGGIAENELMRQNIVGHYRSRTYQGKLVDGNAAANNRSRANRGAIADYGRGDQPVVSRFKLPIKGNSTGKKVVGKTHMGTNEDAILQGYALKDRGVVLNLDP